MTPINDHPDSIFWPLFCHLKALTGFRASDLPIDVVVVLTGTLGLAVQTAGCIDKYKVRLTSPQHSDRCVSSM